MPPARDDFAIQLDSSSPKETQAIQHVASYQEADDMQLGHVRVPLIEAVGHDRVRRARERLSQLQPPGKYQFHLNTAAYPLPFFPECITVTRENLERSNFNGLHLGSVYNNWTLSTIFREGERNFISVDKMREKYTELTRDEFLALQIEYFKKNDDIKGDQNDLSTWRRESWFTADNRVDADYRVRGVLRAASKSSTFVVLKDTEIVEIRPVEVASHEKLKMALDKLFIGMRMSKKVEQGVAVPAMGRAIVIWTWLVAMLGLVTYGAHVGWSGLELWTKEHFETVVFACVSVPALVEYISNEPSVIRNALRANRVLWSNSQVQAYFDLEKLDYAVMALLNDPMWLVSDDKSSFTQQGGHPGMIGDETVTDTYSLRCVGFFVGRVMARKEWEDFNMEVANRSDGSVYIVRGSRSGAKRISGEGINRPVG